MPVVGMVEIVPKTKIGNRYTPLKSHRLIDFSAFNRVKITWSRGDSIKRSRL